MRTPTSTIEPQDVSLPHYSSNPEEPPIRLEEFEETPFDPDSTNHLDDEIELKTPPFKSQTETKAQTQTQTETQTEIQTQTQTETQTKKSLPYGCRRCSKSFSLKIARKKYEEECKDINIFDFKDELENTPMNATNENIILSNTIESQLEHNPLTWNSFASLEIMPPSQTMPPNEIPTETETQTQSETQTETQTETQIETQTETQIEALKTMQKQ
jgi:hypothetical protein